jgi:hypothetical protein
MTSMDASANGIAVRPASWLERYGLRALVVIAYVSVFPYSPAINSPNENVRVYMTRALVEHHELAINKIESEWGWVNDKAKNGTRVFSGKAPGVSVLGVPVLAAQTWLWHRFGWPSPSQLATTLALRLFAVILPMCGFLWILCGYLRRVVGSSGFADLLFVGVALGSLIYPYAIHFVGHSLAAATSFGAFMVLVPDREITSSRSRIALAGLLAGLGVLFEYQNLLVAALLAGYVAVRRPRLLFWFAAGASPAAIALGVYHSLCFGSPWAFPYAHLENATFQTAHHAKGFHGLSLPEARNVLSVLFLPGFGLFANSPFLLIATAALGWAVVRGPRAEALLCAAVAALLVTFIGGLSNWRGGWSVGPRYIAAVVPFLTVGLAYVWPTISASRFAGSALALTAGLIATGVLFNATPAILYPQYPTQLRNPTFQLLLPLPFEGYVPYSLGYALRLRGLPSLVPTLLAVVGALALAFRSASDWQKDRRRALKVILGAILIFAVVGGAFALWARDLSPGERAAIQLVKGTWTPRPERAPK